MFDSTVQNAIAAAMNIIAFRAEMAVRSNHYASSRLPESLVNNNE